LLYPRGKHLSSASLRTLPLSLCAGASLACFGGALKALSSWQLGSFYNASLDLQPAHRLITDGPYSYIRHPGYTGAILGICGITMCHLSPHSWLRECGLLRSGLGKLIVGVWMAWNAAWTAGLISRADEEERVLERRFGVVWKHWAWMVPNRFIPGIY